MSCSSLIMSQKLVCRQSHIPANLNIRAQPHRSGIAVQLPMDALFEDIAGSKTPDTPMRISCAGGVRGDNRHRDARAAGDGHQGLLQLRQPLWGAAQLARLPSLPGAPGEQKQPLCCWQSVTKPQLARQSRQSLRRAAKLALLPLAHLVLGAPGAAALQRRPADAVVLMN